MAPHAGFWDDGSISTTFASGVPPVVTGTVSPFSGTDRSGAGISLDTWR